RDRNAHLGAHLHGRLDIVGAFWDHYAERLDLINAGVGAVDFARRIIEPHLAGDVPAKVLLQEVAFEFGEVHERSIKSPPPRAPGPSSPPLPPGPFCRLRGARLRRNPAVPPAPCASRETARNRCRSSP